MGSLFGPARFLVLDSEAPYERGSHMRTFADSVADAWSKSPEIPSFAALHIPPYSNGGHRSDLNIRRELCPLFERAGVLIVFSGHDHGYEATWPLLSGRKDGKGPVYVVSAGGGARLYDAIDNRPAWSRIRLKRHHWVNVRINKSHVVVQAVAPNGEILDRFSIPMRRSPITTID